jgi:cytochrome P450
VTYELALFAMPSGAQWAYHRKALQPAFGPSQLRHAITVTNEIVALAIDKINERIEKGNGVGIVDAPRLATSLTADVMYAIGLAVTDWESCLRV